MTFFYSDLKVHFVFFCFCFGPPASAASLCPSSPFVPSVFRALDFCQTWKRKTEAKANFISTLSTLKKMKNWTPTTKNGTKSRIVSWTIFRKLSNRSWTQTYGMKNFLAVTWVSCHLYLIICQQHLESSAKFSQDKGDEVESFSVLEILSCTLKTLRDSTLYYITWIFCFGLFLTIHLTFFL